MGDENCVNMLVRSAKAWETIVTRDTPNVSMSFRGRVVKSQHNFAEVNLAAKITKDILRTNVPPV